MNQEIKVSIICNVYNHEKYLRDALNGFVMQETDFPFEVLVHDDASTDSSADIIREYEAKYPEIIKPIYQTVNQYSQKINISHIFQQPRAQGKYIAFCEGDDYWTDPKKLQKQCDFLDAHPDYSMCVSSTTWLNMLTGRTERRHIVEQDMDIPVEDIILEKNGRIFQLGSVVLRKDVWVQRPAWRSAFPIGDLALAIQAGLNGKVHMLADVMTVYRWYTDGSWTARMDTDEHRAAVSLRMIEGLTLLNEATDHRYDAVISQRLKRHKYIHAVMSHDLQAIRSPELRDIYNSRKWYYHVAVYIRCKFPKFYTRVLKPLIRSV